MKRNSSLSNPASLSVIFLLFALVTHHTFWKNPSASGRTYTIFFKLKLGQQKDNITQLLCITHYLAWTQQPFFYLRELVQHEEMIMDGEISVDSTHTKRNKTNNA